MGWWSMSLWVDVRMFHSVLAASVKVTFYTSSLQLCLPSAVLLMMGCAAGCREPRMSWTGWAGPAPQRPPTPGPRGTTPPAKVSRLCAATSFMSGCIDRHYYSWASSSSITRSDHRWEMIAANRSSKNTVIVSHRSQSEIKLSLSLSILSLTTHHAAVSSDEVRSFKPFQRKRFLNSNVWKQDRSLAWWSELFFSFPGKYLHIKSSHPSLKGSRAQLKSAVLPPAGKDGYCFTLWYHMFGATVGDLKIFLRTVDTLEEELVPFFYLFIKNTIKQEKQLSFIFKPGCLTSPSCTVGTDWAILWLFPLDFLLVVLFFKVVKSWLQNYINVRLKDARQRNISVLQKHPHILIMNFCLSCRFGKSQEAKRTSGFCLRPTWPYREPTRWFWRPRWGGRLET